MQSKYWVWTLNNYTDDEQQHLRDLGGHEDVSYIVFGREIGAEGGTPHLQGYTEFRRRLRLNQVKGLLGDRLHLERRRGSGQQARNYSIKDGDFEEFGSLATVHQGRRTDLETACADVLAGKRPKDIAAEHAVVFTKYHRGLLALRSATQPKRTWKPSVKVLWGDPGTGKTRSVYEAEQDVYSHPGGPWFDGYDGQEAVLFDDFTGSCFKLQYLLKLLDRYPMDVPVKGGFVNWIPRRIYITSNVPVDEWYGNARPIHVAALRRRLDSIVHYTNLQ